MKCIVAYCHIQKEEGGLDLVTQFQGWPLFLSAALGPCSSSTPAVRAFFSMRHSRDNHLGMGGMFWVSGSLLDNKSWFLPR